MVGWKPYSVPSLRLTVASPLSGAVNSRVRPSGNVTLIVTTGAYVCAAASALVTRLKNPTLGAIPIMVTSVDSHHLFPDIPSHRPDLRRRRETAPWLRRIEMFVFR